MLKLVIGQLQGILIKDVQYIVTTLVNGRQRAKGSNLKASAEKKDRVRWPLYQAGVGGMYMRLCEMCADEEELKPLSSDKGKRRHVVKCEECGQAA